MTIVYDKDGKEYKVTHYIDVPEWIAAGYTLENPKEKKTRASKGDE